MRVEVRYFSVLKEQAGKPGETIEFSGTTPEELWQHLRERYGFDPLPHLKVAINDEYVTFATEIREGDLVVFIPPVAGG